MIIVPKCTLQKIQQLRFLIQSLLPKNSDDPTLIPSIDDFLDDEQPISLSALRHLSLENGSHTHTWTARAPVGTLSTGDFGRIPPGDDFAAFELLGNIFEEEDTAKALAVLSEVDGTQLFRSNTVTERKPAKPYFPAGSEALEGWSLSLLFLQNSASQQTQVGCCASSSHLSHYLLGPTPPYCFYQRCLAISLSEFTFNR